MNSAAAHNPSTAVERLLSVKTLQKFLVFGLICLYSVTFFAKIFALGNFRSVLATSRLLPLNWVAPVAIGILAVEGTIVAMLLLPRFRQLGALASAAFGGASAGYAIWRWMEGIESPCGCFGILFNLTLPESLWLAASLVFCSLLAFALLSRSSSPHLGDLVASQK